MNPGNPNAERVIRDMQEAVSVKGVSLQVLKGTSEAEIDAAFASLAQRHAGALVIGPDPVFAIRNAQIEMLASQHAIPTIHFGRDYAVAGGLISYGPSIAAAFLQAGIYAGRILKGEKPADLPVVQPTTFELVINLKTAKALGITVPSALLGRANEIIE
jgi:putative ABC transport system substrate-binding protein